MENILINNTYQIILPSSSLMAKPNDFSTLETECLYGETIKVLSHHEDWINCQLLTDNYIGWLKKNSIGRTINSNFRIIVPRTFVYFEANSKSQVNFELSIGCRIKASNYNEQWSKVFLDSKDLHNIGYIPKNHIIKITKKYNDWVSVAESLINTPYKWGGKDSKGIDCSGLVQLALQTQLLDFPRNTSFQKNMPYPIITDLEEIQRGMLIFWDGHVAISLDKEKMIHANAFHMMTFKEPIFLANNRISKKYGDIISVLDLRNI